MIGYINVIANYSPNFLQSYSVQLDTTYDFRIFHSITQAALATNWDEIVPKEQLFLQRKYLAVLEETNKDKIDCRYAVLYKEKVPVGIAYFQLLQFTSENFRYGEKEKAAQTATTKESKCECPGAFVSKQFKNIIRKTLDSFSMRLLVCGNALVTGEYGFYYHSQVAAPQAYHLLEAIIETIQKEEQKSGKSISAILVKDFHPNNLSKGQKLVDYSFQEIASQPNMVLYVKEKWNNFQDYLSSMSSKYRVRAKSKRKKGKSIIRRSLSLTEIEQQLNRIYELYEYVADRADINMAKATPTYFSTLKKQLGEQFQLIGYYLEDKLIGFICTFTFGTHLEAHFVGYDPAYNRNFALYNNILYDIVNMGIEQKAQTISFGRTASEIKSTLGAVAVEMNSFIRHKNFISNRMLRPLIDHFREDDWTPRHPFKDDK